MIRWGVCLFVAIAVVFLGKNTVRILDQAVIRRITIVIAVALAASVSIAEICIFVPGITPARKNNSSQWLAFVLSRIIRTAPMIQIILIAFFIHEPL